MRARNAFSRLALVLLAETCDASLDAARAETVLVDVAATTARLLAEEDLDRDLKITIDDRAHFQSQTAEASGDARFTLEGRDGQQFVIEGTYPLANLLQELRLATEKSLDTAAIDLDRVFENPVARISRHIRDMYWDNLTRRVDLEHLPELVHDEKMPGTPDRFHVYVPASDPVAASYFSKCQQPNITVSPLPQTISPEYVRQLGPRHGLLTLALRKRGGAVEGVPFVVPGGRFNEMYGWDSYFEALGLLVDGKTRLAQDMVDNFVYQIEHYGKILNANRTYYLTRSQPPFLTSMALAVLEQLRREDQVLLQTSQWRDEVLVAAIREYREVWMNDDHLTTTGLSRYFGTGIGPPPEVEPGHFDSIYRSYAGNMDVRDFELRYQRGEFDLPALDAFFVHDRAVRESGHDTTYRWHVDGADRCADFVTVDLNALLHKFEIDIARIIEREHGGRFHPVGVAAGTIAQEESSDDWYEAARQRRERMFHYLWDNEAGMFFDYDLVRQQRHTYYSATCLYPLWAIHPDDPETWILDREQATRLVAALLSRLEMPGGLAASAKVSRDAAAAGLPERQWDYPNGWPPHQMLAWRALLNYGMRQEADRLIYRWLYTITRNAADYNGTVPEKFDVVRRTHKVFVEYGNVGTKFAYITKEGFGWMNASYQVGLELLSRELREHLERLEAPESLFDPLAGQSKGER